MITYEFKAQKDSPHKSAHLSALTNLPICQPSQICSSVSPHKSAHLSALFLDYNVFLHYVDDLSEVIVLQKKIFSRKGRQLSKIT